ncbi:hypothetical protein F4804DRAFT_315354 [Jackrogersella minutella]|nr:hypothetical protein F4804DRAFT_315354 [Jackrogersella minutella]
MAGRRRPATRRTESVEPAHDIVTRQTRQSTRRPEPLVELEPRPLPEIPARGTRRQRRRSLESVATNDFPKDDIHPSKPDPEDLHSSLVPESEISHHAILSETEDTYESPEMEAARIQDMLDFDIPKLTRWSGKLYDILSSIDNKQLSVDTWSSLNSCKKSYNHARLLFAENGALFIKPISLPEDYDQEVRTKILAAICSGNIVSLLLSIVNILLRKKGALPILEQLDEFFPTLFIAHVHADNDDADKLLDLAFRIRYHLLLESIISNPSVKPLKLATSIFCTEGVRGSSRPRDALHTGPYRQLAAMDINEDGDSYEIYRNLIKELVDTLSSIDISELQGSPDQDCPQEELFSDLRSWALEIYQQINKKTDNNHIQTKNQIPQPQTRAERENSESLFVHNDGRAGEDSDSVSDSEVGGYDQLPVQESNRNYINDFTTLAAVRQSEKKEATRPAATPPSNQQAVKGRGKNKALNTTEAIRLLEPRQILDRKRKRSRQSGDDDTAIRDDGGDDFEVNEQLLNESARLRRKDTPIRRSPAKRRRFSKQPSLNGSQALSPPAASSREIVRAQPRTTLDDQQEDCSLQERDILVLSQNAQSNRRANSISKPRQVRVPWSVSETSRLLDLIADPSLSCAWSKMENAGGFENARSQQALRDKARSLKVWYLEGDRVLPVGFDQIALGQKERDAVIKCGRNPDRKEDDLDEDGEVINNLWA